MAKEIKDMQELEAELKTSQVVVVDFFAQWCAPCKLLIPMLENFHLTYPNVLTLSVDVDECMDVAEKFGVYAMPTFKVIKDGEVVDTVIGADPELIEQMYMKYNIQDLTNEELPVEECITDMDTSIETEPPTESAVNGSGESA